MFIYTDAGFLNLEEGGHWSQNPRPAPLQQQFVVFPTFSGYKGALDSVGHDQYCTVILCEIVEKKESLLSYPNKYFSSL